MGSLNTLGKFAGRNIVSAGRRIYAWLHPERANAVARMERIDRARMRAARRASSHTAEEGTSPLKKVAKVGAVAGVTGGTIISDPFQFNIWDPISYYLFSGRSPQMKAQPGDYIKWQNKKRGWTIPTTKVDEESAKIKQAKEMVDKSQSQQTQQQHISVKDIDQSIYLNEDEYENYDRK